MQQQLACSDLIWFLKQRPAVNGSPCLHLYSEKNVKFFFVIAETLACKTGLIRLSFKLLHRFAVRWRRRRVHRSMLMSPGDSGVIALRVIILPATRI
jgi:hypothetical protein